MRVARKSRHNFRLECLHRGYRRLALRAVCRRRSAKVRALPAGGVIVGPRGARRLALDIVRSEIAASCYVTDGRLDRALERLVAGL